MRILYIQENVSGNFSLYLIGTRNGEIVPLLQKILVILFVEKQKSPYQIGRGMEEGKVFGVGMNRPHLYSWLALANNIRYNAKATKKKRKDRD